MRIPLLMCKLIIYVFKGNWTQQQEPNKTVGFIKVIQWLLEYMHHFNSRLSILAIYRKRNNILLLFINYSKI